jgi:hypothetical protein
MKQFVIIMILQMLGLGIFGSLHTNGSEYTIEQLVRTSMGVQFGYSVSLVIYIMITKFKDQITAWEITFPGTVAWPFLFLAMFLCDPATNYSYAIGMLPSLLVMTIVAHKIFD